MVVKSLGQVEGAVPAVSKVRDLDDVLAWLNEGRAYRSIVDAYPRKYDVFTSVSM